MVTITFLMVMLFAVALFSVNLNASAQNLTLSSIFVKENPDNTTSYNGTIHTLEGTDEEIIKQYYELADEMDKKLVTKPSEVTFVFQNNTNMTIPYDEYKSTPPEEFIDQIMSIKKLPGGCWIWREGPQGLQEWHWVQCPMPKPPSRP
jgi:hypothetical protein